MFISLSLSGSRRSLCLWLEYCTHLKRAKSGGVVFDLLVDRLCVRDDLCVRGAAFCVVSALLCLA